MKTLVAVLTMIYIAAFASTTNDACLIVDFPDFPYTFSGED